MGNFKIDTTRLKSALYLVATPIGSARDITLRALDVLAVADILAAEDTRNTRKLMDIHGIALNGRRLMSYHDHNGAAQRPKILEALMQGQSVALVSDAGTPLVADPGYALVKAVIEAGLGVVPVPGASALLAAICVAGLPSDRFIFAGFPPVKEAARERFFSQLSTLEATIVFYESPKRVHRSLTSMAENLGKKRAAVVCRELTKKFEEQKRGTLEELQKYYDSDKPPKGEIVIVVGPPKEAPPSEEELDQALRLAIAQHGFKEGVHLISKAMNQQKRQIYARALRIQNESSDPDVAGVKKE